MGYIRRIPVSQQDRALQQSTQVHTSNEMVPESCSGDSGGPILLSTGGGTSFSWYSSPETTKKLLTPGVSALQHTHSVRQDVDAVQRKVLKDLLHKTNLTLLEQIAFSSVTGNVKGWKGETKRILTQKRDPFCSEYWSPCSRKKPAGSHSQSLKYFTYFSNS